MLEIPKVISKNGHEYVFMKKNNENTFLYKDLLYGYLETFCRYDLGLINNKNIDKKIKIEDKKTNRDNYRIRVTNTKTDEVYEYTKIEELAEDLKVSKYTIRNALSKQKLIKRKYFAEEIWK